MVQVLKLPLKIPKTYFSPSSKALKNLMLVSSYGFEAPLLQLMDPLI